jgi:hypothetical protein
MSDESGVHGEVHLTDHVGLTDGLTVAVTLTADGVVSSVDSLGLTVDQTYKITASPVDESGTYPYEFRDFAGSVLASDIGNELTDALLGLAVELEGKGPHTEDE